MEIESKKTITGIALAAVVVGGMFTFMPSASADLTALDKIGTIINILLNIQEDLLDKLTLRVQKDPSSPAAILPEDDDGTFTITITATNAAGELRNFNLKEVYACGRIGGGDLGQGTITVREVNVEEGDIRIRNAEGGHFVGEGAPVLVVDSTSGDAVEACADLITLIRSTDRAGEVGLGSDSDVEIILEASVQEGRAGLSIIKCIAFVPQEVETLNCDATAQEEDD